MTVSSFFMKKHWRPGEPKVPTYQSWTGTRHWSLVLRTHVRTCLILFGPVLYWMIPGQPFTKTSLKLEGIWSLVQAGFIPQMPMPTQDAMYPAAPFSAQASHRMQTHRRSWRPFHLLLSTKLTKKKKPSELFFKLELQDTLETYLVLSLNWYHQPVSYWLLSYWRTAWLSIEQITRKCLVSQWVNGCLLPEGSSSRGHV